MAIFWSAHFPTGIPQLFRVHWSKDFSMPEADLTDARARRVTEIFDALRADNKTDEEIFAEAAGALKQLARRMTAREPAGASMHASRLLNEVYIKLFERPASEFRWENGEDFFIAVARAMQDLKRGYFRRKMAHKRNKGMIRSLEPLNEEDEKAIEVPAYPVPYAGWAHGAPPANKNLFEEKCATAQTVNEALQRLWKEFPDRAKAIVLAEVEGLTYEEIAQILKKSPETVKKDLQKGRARMKHYLTSADT